MKGVRTLAVGWQIWLFCLVTFNLLVPLFLITQLEAQITIGAFFVGSAIGMILVHLQGFTRLLGLMHIAWIPMVVYFWMRLPLHPTDQFFGIWLRLVIALNSISLVIDIVDMARYLLGDRKATDTNA